MPSPVELHVARDAVAHGRWVEAREALVALADLAESPEALELLAAAEYGATGLDAAVAAWEQLHALHLRRDEPVEAAHAAAMLAVYLLMDSGLMAGVRAWAGRAERLLANAGETPVHALIALSRAYERFMCGDLEQAGLWARRAVDLGTRHEVEPATVFGRTCLARLQILDGHIEEGLAELDRLAAVLLSGEVDHLASGMMMCELVCAMQGLGQLDRAEEWTTAYDAMRGEGWFFGSMGGRCRVHRAELLRMRGACAEAEAEAERACEELRPWMRREFGWPLTELGTIRLRRGDVAGAEQAFVAAHASGWEPHPGLALVRFVQGDLDAAAELLREALKNPVRIPSKERPPVGGLSRAPLLEAQVEVSVAAGDLLLARSAATELSELAARYASRGLVAGAALAAGRVALAVGDPATAIVACREAVDIWCVVGAPFEAASARLVLAAAHAAAGEPAVAEAERLAATAGLHEIGATVLHDPSETRVAARVADAVGSAPVDGDDPAPSAASEAAVFRRSGDSRVVRYLGEEVVVRDLVGMRYLETLLARPGHEVHVLDLVAAGRGVAAEEGKRLAPIAGTGPALDDQARRAYQRRLAEIEEEVEDAERSGDLRRAELGRNDRDFLVAELTRAFGLGGRAREQGATAERARTSVTRSVRYALDKLALHHPGLGVHLQHAVRTGIFCAYDPDPSAVPGWRL